MTSSKKRNKDQLARAIIDLSELVSRLRGPDGCPWDIEQTDSTIRLYLLEEAYEVLDAIENGSSENVCEELGDLLFQIIFLADLAEARGEFDLVEVMEKIITKMKRRHPHVFGQEYLKSPTEVSKKWDEIKRTEKGSPEDMHNLLAKIPVNMPALMRAHRLIERASKTEVDLKENEVKIWEKAKGAFEDLQRASANGDQERIGNIMGDLLFSLADLARHFGYNAEDVLRVANNEFLKNHPRALR